MWIPNMYETELLIRKFSMEKMLKFGKNRNLETWNGESVEKKSIENTDKIINGKMKKNEI